MPSPRHVAKRLAHHAKNHFIPHEGNGYHPHALKHRVLLAYSISLVFLKVVVLSASVFLPSSSSLASAITPVNIVALTNATRRQAGIPMVEMDEKLTRAAQAKAQDMAVNAYFAHTSPAGLTPWYWIKKFGYVYRYSAENLAVHFSEAEDVQSGWLASPSHRANIVDSRYRHIGVGVAVGQFQGFPSTFVVQLFGTPKTEESSRATSASPTTIVKTAPEKTVPRSPSSTSLAQVKSANDVQEDEDPQVQPEVEDRGVNILPAKNRYVVSVSSVSTTKASLHLAGKTVDLLQPDSHASATWVGSIEIPKTTVSPGGESLYLSQESKDGSSATRAIALVTPDSKITSLFNVQAESSPAEMKLFGIFTLGNLQDSVRRVYVFFIIFLAAVLLVNILVKIRIQKISVIAHGFMVLTLGVVLYLL